MLVELLNSYLVESQFNIYFFVSPFARGGFFGGGGCSSL